MLQEGGIYMNICRNRLEFENKAGGYNAFYSDIIKLHRHRNVFYFMKQIYRGIRLELYNKW